MKKISVLMKNSVCFHKKSCQTIVALPQTTVWQSPIIYLFLCEPPDRIKEIDPQKDRHNRGDRAQHDKLSRQLAVAAHVLRHRIGRRRNRSRVHFKVNKTFHTGKPSSVATARITAGRITILKVIDGTTYFRLPPIALKCSVPPSTTAPAALSDWQTA